MIQEETLYCDCGCGAKMAVRRGNDLIIRNKQHSAHHELVLRLDKLKPLALESQKA